MTWKSHYYFVSYEPGRYKETACKHGPFAEQWQAEEAMVQDRTLRYRRTPDSHREYYVLRSAVYTGVERERART